ncbi:MAG: DUF4912 domain-containing protein [Gloeotrichia echinulata IR180]
MWQQQKKDSSIVSLALLLALATIPTAGHIFVSTSVWAQSATATSFPLPQTVENGTIIRIDGSSSLATINQNLKESFEKQFSGTKVEVATNGTDAALQALQDGKIDIAAIGRGLTKEEKARGLELVRLRREKIAIIVGADNPFQGSLTTRQFAKIFRGEITNWSQVGGPDQQIRLIDRPATSETRNTFRNYPVFKTADFATGANATQIAEDNTTEIVKQLGKDGISYAVANQVSKLPGVRVVQLHQTLANNPRYPFSQPLVYAYKKNPSKGTAGFIGFAIAQPGKQAIESARVAEATAIANTGSQLLAVTTIATPTTEATTAAIATPTTEATTAAIATPTTEATTAAIATPTTEATTTAIATPTTEATTAAIATPTTEATTAAIATPTTEATTAAIATPTTEATTAATPASSEQPANNNPSNPAETWLWWLLLPIALIAGLLWWFRGRGSTEPTDNEPESTPNPSPPAEANSIAPPDTSIASPITEATSHEAQIESTASTPSNITSTGAAVAGGAALAGAAIWSTVSGTGAESEPANDTAIRDSVAVNPPESAENAWDIEAPAAVVNTSYPQLSDVTPDVELPTAEATTIPELPEVTSDVELPTVEATAIPELPEVTADVELPTVEATEIPELPELTADVELPTVEATEIPELPELTADVELPTVEATEIPELPEVTSDVELPTVEATTIPELPEVTADVESPTVENPEQPQTESNWLENITSTGGATLAAGAALAAGAGTVIWSSISGKGTDSQNGEEVNTSIQLPEVTADVELPTVEATTIPELPEVTADVELPTAEATTIPELPELTADVELPTVEATTIPELPEVTADVELPTVEATTIPELPEVTADVELPTVEATTIPELPDVTPDVESPTVENPEQPQTQSNWLENITSTGGATLAAGAALAAGAGTVIWSSISGKGTDSQNGEEVNTSAQLPEVTADVELPTVEATTIPELPEVTADVELPTVEATTIPELPEVTADVELPTVEATTIPELPEVTADVELPTVEATEIPELPDVTPDVELPTVEATTIPELPEVTADVELPTVEATTIPELPEVTADVELPTVENPEQPQTESNWLENITSTGGATLAAGAALAAGAGTVIWSSISGKGTDSQNGEEVNTLAQLPELTADVELPTVEATTIPELPEVTADVELPTVEATTIPELPEVTADVELPTVEATTIPELPEVTADVELPTVEATTIPELPEVTADVELPTVEATTIPELPEVTADVELPTVEATTIPELPEVTADVELPTVEATTIPELPEVTSDVELPTVEATIIPELPEVPDVELNAVADEAESTGNFTEEDITEIPSNQPEETTEDDRGINPVTIAGGAALAAGVGIAAWANIDGIQESLESEVQTHNQGDNAPVVSHETADYPNASIILRPHTPKWAYASWEISEIQKEALQNADIYQLTLRLYDVNEIDLSYQSPHLVEEYEVEETTQDRFVAIPTSDRDYIAEIGYVTDDEQWLTIARSATVRVFSNAHLEEETADTLDANAQSSIILTPRTPKWAYASWEIADTEKAALRNAQISQLALRLYDITDIDLSYQSPHLVQQYEVEEITQDRFVAIPTSDRDYIAEIGYLTDEEHWVLIARSATVRVFSRPHTDFWFVADAELIIHGATTPDANVTIAGQSIKLKPDGTFHLRVPFSQSLIEYLITAAAADGQQARTIHKKFSQETPED